MEQYTEKLRWWLLRTHLAAVLQRSEESGSGSGSGSGRAQFGSRARALLSAGGADSIVELMPACGICGDDILYGGGLQAQTGMVWNLCIQCRGALHFFGISGCHRWRFYS